MYNCPPLTAALLPGSTSPAAILAILYPFPYINPGTGFLVTPSRLLTSSGTFVVMLTPFTYNSSNLGVLEFFIVNLFPAITVVKFGSLLVVFTSSTAISKSCSLLRFNFFSPLFPLKLIYALSLFKTSFLDA